MTTSKQRPGWQLPLGTGAGTGMWWMLAYQ